MIYLLEALDALVLATKRCFEYLPTVVLRPNQTLASLPSFAATICSFLILAIIKKNNQKRQRLTYHVPWCQKHDLEKYFIKFYISGANINF